MTAEALTELLDALSGETVEVVDLTQPLAEATPIIQLPPPFANTPGWKMHEISRYADRDFLLSVDDVKAFERLHGPLSAGGWLLYRTGWDARAGPGRLPQRRRHRSPHPRRQRGMREVARRGGPDRRVRRRDRGNRRRRGPLLRARVPLPHLPPRREQVRPHATGQPVAPAADRRRADRRAAEDRERFRQPHPCARPGAEVAAGIRFDRATSTVRRVFYGRVIEPPVVEDTSVSSGDLRAAFERLATPLLRLCLLLTGNRETAEDLVQDSFIRLAPKLGGLEAADVGPYLSRIAINLWKNRLRRLAVERRASARVAAPTAGSTEERMEDRDLVVRALRELPPRKRACIVLRYYADLPR